MRSRNVLVLLLMLASILAAFIPGAAEATSSSASSDKILRVWYTDEWIDELEPQSNNSGTGDLTHLTYEGLTRFDEELNVVPGAAESWAFNAAGTMITFRLHENLTYSDGSPLTAERFRYAIERACSPQSSSWDASDIFDIVGCEALHASLQGGDSTPEAGASTYEAAKANLGVRALDDRTLEIELNQPAPYFPALAQSIVFSPVKQELVEAGGAEWWRDAANWVGNGPFQLSEFAPDADPPVIKFVRNERYWAGSPNLDGIEYVFMDMERALDAYRRGELDIVQPADDALPEIETDPILSRDLIRMPSPFVDVFNLNLLREPFQDKQVREAFAYGFDRAAYCREITRDSCIPMLSWMPPFVPGAIETDAYAFDPAQARAALAASAYGGPDDLPEIIWYYAEDDAWSLEQAEWLAAQYRQVLGVDLTLAEVTWDEIEAMQETAATYPQIANSYWWADPADPHGWMKFWTCESVYFAAKTGYCNPDYDALVARADRELDRDERISLVEESQRLLVSDAPAVFGSYWDVFRLVKPYVTGFSPTAPYQGYPGYATPLTLDIDRSA